MSGRQVSREVYWRRRFLVLAAAIALIWGLVQVVGLMRGDDKDPEPRPAATAGSKPTPGPSADPTPTPAPETSDAVDPGTMVPISLTTVTKECEAENLRIQPMVPAGQQAGKSINVEFLVNTLDSSACTFTPGKRDLLIVVEANKKAIYDSSVCQQSFFDSPVVIARGFGTLVRTNWSGRGSGPACSPMEHFASGGNYTMRAGSYGGEPGTGTFELAAAPKPKPKPKPKPSPSPSPSKSKATPTPKPSPKETEAGGD